MEYQDAVKTAEEAVSSMKDPKLKEIAFGQILEKLLSSKDQAPLRKVPASRSRNAGPEKQATSKKKDGIIDWVRELVANGFFKEPRSSKMIRAELAEQSHHLHGTDLIWPLRHLCHTKMLRRKKISIAEGKATVWHWSNW